MLRYFLRLRPPSRPFASQPTFARFSPWSARFAGTQSTRIILQSFTYAVIMVGATQLVDSYFFVRDEYIFLFLNLTQNVYSRCNRFNIMRKSMHLLENCRKLSKNCTIPFLNQTLSSQIQAYFVHTARPRTLIIQPHRILSLCVVISASKM